MGTVLKLITALNQLIWIVNHYWPNMDQSSGSPDECEKWIFEFKLDRQENDKTYWNLEPVLVLEQCG